MPGLTLIADWVAAGQEFGVFDFYLPFIITFAIFWALLTKVKLFGDPFATEAGKKKQAKVSRAVNLIISLAASLYIMANTGLGVSFAMFLSGLFGGTFMVVMTIIAFVSVVYIAATIAKGGDPFKVEEGRNIWPFIATFTIIGAILFALSVYISSGGAAFFPGLVLPGFEVPSIPTLLLPSINLTSSDLAIIFLVVLTGLIVLYVTWGGGEGRRRRPAAGAPPTS